MELNFSDIIKIIPNYSNVDEEELILSLKELEEMVGLDKVKRLILGQVAYGLMLLERKDLNRNKYMLHTLITGPPGVGKTNLAKILGKIWCSMRIFNTSEICVEEECSEIETAMSNNFQFISDKVDIIKELLPEDVLHMKEEYNSEEEPILWRLDKIKDMCHEFRREFHKGHLSTTSKFIKVTRADLVGKWQGHTADKTLKVLKSALNGVLFIDEAYQLITSHDDNGDNFGAECLTTINEFMSEHPDKIIIIFGGYNDSMNETIFRVQPGLKRRFNWHFNIESYTSSELAHITIKQFTDENWKLGPDVSIQWLSDFITTNLKYFKSFGGDTQRLVFYTIIEHSIYRVLQPNLEIDIINRAMIVSAFSKIHKPVINSSPTNMYL